MAYITQAEIEEQLPAEQLIQLTDDDGDGVADASVVADLIADAEAEVNGYLQTRYTLPLATVPQLIKKYTANIAVYNAFGRRQRVSEAVTKRYDDTVKALDKIAKGQITLGIEDPPPATSSDDVKASRPASGRVFTRGDSENSGSLDNF